MSDPTTAITAAENALRELIEITLPPALGSDWLAECGVTPERMQKLQERLVEERKRRSGAVVDERLLSYSDLTDLQVIITKHWERFGSVFHSRKRFVEDMERLLAFRIALAHGRELLPFERLLAEGVSGEVRNRVTLQRNTLAPDGQEYFPRFEFVRDSLGNVREGGAHFFPTESILRPGDTVTFECRSWDPEGHPVLTEWSKGSFTDKNPFDDRFDWEVGEQDIGEVTAIEIILISDRAYHRYFNRDDYVSFVYTVLPHST